MLVVYVKETLDLAYVDDKVNEFNPDILNILKPIHGEDKTFDYFLQDISLADDEQVFCDVINTNGKAELIVTKSKRAPEPPPQPTETELLEERLKATEDALLSIMMM